MATALILLGRAAGHRMWLTSRIVIYGATSGDAPPAELTRIFLTQLPVVGSTMGTRD